MSFIITPDVSGIVYAPGYFLAHEECIRKTRQIPQAGASTSANGGKYVKMGTFYPANNSSTVEGIVYEDVDVTTGDMPGSVVTKGVVYINRLPVAPESGVQSALEAKGFVFIDEPAVSRPDFGPDLKAITVASAAGTASGDTKITLTYTPNTGETYMYKVATGTAPTIARGDIPDSTWTAWDGEDDITAATGKKITIIAVDEFGKAVAAGSATVTAQT